MTKERLAKYRAVFSILLITLVFIYFTRGLAWHNYVVGAALVGTLIHAWFFERGAL